MAVPFCGALTSVGSAALPAPSVLGCVCEEQEGLVTLVWGSGFSVLAVWWQRGTGIQPLGHSFVSAVFSQVGMLKPHPAFTQLLETAAEPTLTFETTEVPMLCPPRPWTSPHSGGYLLSSPKLMRTVEGTMQHQRLLEGCAPAQLHGALDALTQLGNCAWRVNGRLLDLVLQIFRDKGCARLGVPPPRSEAPLPIQQPPPPDSTPLDKAELRKELARCLKAAREMHSLRSEALYRLSLAQHLRHQVFWLPHNMDFRGRTYPCPPHFNHLGSDLARALLEFAEGKPLGPNGLEWLKIHLVNLTGLKKSDSLRMRIAFADEVMEEILDSADNPMTVGCHKPSLWLPPSLPPLSLCPSQLVHSGLGFLLQINP